MVLTIMLSAGCRTATRVVDYPRADLEIEAGGNRGYLVGAPPASSGPWKSTRQMVETEVELPPFAKGAAGLRDVAPPEIDMADESAWSGAGASGEMIGTHTVTSGETLWSIAAKPNVYHDATKWRLIFEANRDVLKSPDRLKAGMTLRIPRAGPDGGAAGQAAESEPDGLTFRK